MSKETDRLEREAEIQRRRLDSTLAQIESKFSAGAIVDELGGYLRRGQGAAMLRNFNHQVRDNPLALGFIGAGVAWLLMGKGVRQSADNVKERYRDWREHDEPEVSKSGQDGHPPQSRGDYGDFPSAGEPVSANGDWDGNGHDKSSNGHSTVDDARDRISAVASDAREKLHDTTHRASKAARSAGHWTSDRLHEGSEAGQRALRVARRGGRFVGREGQRLARGGGDKLMTAISERPLVVGAVIIAIGAAIGAALPSTRKEDELVGKTRDRLRDKASEFGEDVMQRTSHVAKAAMQAADDRAGEVGLKPQGGETIAEKVSGVAEAAVDAAKDDAKKQGLL